MSLRKNLIRLAHTNPELRPQLLPILKGSAYDGNADGKPIYDHDIDHGYGQPLAGGTDVMRRLQNQYRKEQGRPERPANPEIPKMASRVALRHLDRK